jgi:MOSC domain-containing protein YiiM
MLAFPASSNYNGEPVATGIFKEPVPGPLMLRALNLDGDRQADLSVHGGVHKAVYGYPSEHYEFWRKELPEMNLPYGMFGENFTTEGLFEDAINIGDRFRIGEAELIAAQPRLPCYKLGIKFGRS